MLYRDETITAIKNILENEEKINNLVEEAKGKHRKYVGISINKLFVPMVFSYSDKDKDNEMDKISDMNKGYSTRFIKLPEKPDAKKVRKLVTEKLEELIYMIQNYELYLNQYGAVTNIPMDWKESSLTTTQLKKLNIPTYKCCVGFREGKYYYKPILVNIIPKDFRQIEQDYIIELEAKKSKLKENVQKIELTEKVIGECLYSINKEAKRQRDIQNDFANSIYVEREIRPASHYALYRAKDKKEELYKLKDKTIKKFIEEHKITPIGYHEFADANRDMYIIGGYEFHINEFTSLTCLGSIEDMITQERKRSTPPSKAVMILERYLKEGM